MAMGQKVFGKKVNLKESVFSLADFKLNEHESEL